ncbi:hypothetical protein JF767_14535 [Mycobacterium intracellulare subsp. chimaera]|nr:hypothetical protein [Mycobacterium tuberculosis]MCA2310034.1 hypothetical protein [Mycobacterium intracellulare subsp. chimaera]MCA2353035.1 hypothetical protein [Mycobacterium intracellulare subsp. chimaera]MCV7323616.1 hypothetical protein [Mycobacterium intracellulare subsp. chimaera]QGK49199.1 hypothetical protein GJE02_16415 [Mycobacterium intracellulare subsp. chimaera]
MSLAAWAERNRVVSVTVYRCFRPCLPLPARWGGWADLVDGTRGCWPALSYRCVCADSAESGDDLVADMTEILTSMCARSYGERAAKRAIAAADDREAA